MPSRVGVACVYRTEQQKTIISWNKFKSLDIPTLLYPILGRLLGRPVPSLGALRLPNGLDFFSFWPIFFCFFSIAFFTARSPPLWASASYLARVNSFFLSASNKI